MNVEKQRMAIAKACGWTDHFPKGGGGLLLPYKWYNLNTKEKALDLPDYLNDLNAMHEAEKTLKGLGQSMYEMNLDAVSKHYSYCATSAQRAKAFLKTIGEWKS